MIKQIYINGRQIQYELVYKNVKNINLRIKPDQSVYVSANSFVGLHSIEKFLISKADFIVKSLDEFSQKQKDNIALLNYDKVKYLGEEVNIVVNNSNVNSYEFNKSKLILNLKNPNDFEAKKKLIIKWQTEQCIDVINYLCEKYYPIFKYHGIDFPEIRFRKMKKQWGNCRHSNGILTFNCFLISAPIECIEYVVVHEFAHFLIPNHSNEFYKFIKTILPDFKNRRKLLQDIIVMENYL